MSHQLNSSLRDFQKLDTYREKNYETNLSELYGHKDIIRSSLFAVIVDCTEMFVIESKNLFAIKMKIIDEFFNANIIQKDPQYKF